jgi:succinoglycan biosynthesis protein ExoM
MLEQVMVLYTGDHFTYSITIADNDCMQSAQSVVDEAAGSSPISIIYCVEPEQNIALARNKALDNANGEFIAFIDDDEIPDKYWLANLFSCMFKYSVDGILGPVKPCFIQKPPAWIERGRYFERAEHPTGYMLRWNEMRTGNVLFKKSILENCNKYFDPRLKLGSEDVEFFMRMTKAGFSFVWCNEAIVYEYIYPDRCTRAYLLKRALIRGSMYPYRSNHHARDIGKSVMAIFIYVIALPVIFIINADKSFGYVIKLADHISRLSSYLGWQMIKTRVI